MLESLRLRVTDALKAESAATLSTTGPGGIQAGYFASEAECLTLYLLVPDTSDVLFNLEKESGVIVTTPRWQLEGRAEVHALFQAPVSLQLARSPLSAGCVLVAVYLRRIHLNWEEGWGYRETIDC